MSRHPFSIRHAAGCLAAAMALATSAALAGPPEAFRGPGGVTGLLHFPDRRTGPAAAVLIVHDALGLDRRSHRYIAQLNAAGLAVLEVELRASSNDGGAEPPPDDPEAAELVARTAAALLRDPRVDPLRLGALGFGLGARAVALAGTAEDGHAPFAAHVLLYPGCASLGDMLRASPHARPPRALILHGEDDPANTQADCDDLAATLGSTEQARRIAFPGATYAWDLPELEQAAFTAQPWPGREGRVAARSWPELADLTAARSAAFLRRALVARTASLP